MILLSFLVVLSFLVYTEASFCGSSAIPFSFEALPNGQPVLGCARPSCFGWTASGEPISKNANFYRIGRRADGFMRQASVPKPDYGGANAAAYEQQRASTACGGEDSWVGGIAPLLNVSQFPLVFQCCKYPPLRLSTDQGVAVVRPGQIVVGGEVQWKGRQISFDYISDILKHINEDGTVTYDISIRRMPCLPAAEMNTQVDRHAHDAILKQVRARAKLDKEKAAKSRGNSLPQKTGEPVERPLHIQHLPQVSIAQSFEESSAALPVGATIIEGPFPGEFQAAPIVIPQQQEQQQVVLPTQASALTQFIPSSQQAPDISQSPFSNLPVVIG